MDAFKLLVLSCFVDSNWPPTLRAVLVVAGTGQADPFASAATRALVVAVSKFDADTTESRSVETLG